MGELEKYKRRSCEKGRLKWFTLCCITQMHLNFLHQDSLAFLPPRMLRHIISYENKNYY
jgi:hypothetical protein